MCVVFKPEQLSSDSTPDYGMYFLSFFFLNWSIVALQCWVGMYFLMLITLLGFSFLSFSHPNVSLLLTSWNQIEREQSCSSKY